MTCRPRVDGWMEWGACSQDCYQPGKPRGQRSRKWQCYSNGCREQMPQYQSCNSDLCPREGTVKLSGPKADQGIGMVTGRG